MKASLLLVGHFSLLEDVVDVSKKKCLVFIGIVSLLCCVLYVFSNDGVIVTLRGNACSIDKFQRVVKIT
jgi:hypothetical protein